MFTIKTKLLLMLICAIAAFIGLGIFTVQMQKQLAERVMGIEIETEKVTLITDLQLAVYSAVMPGNDYIITGKSEYAKEFEKLDINARGMFSKIIGNPNFTPEEKDTIKKSETLYLGLVDISGQIFTQNFKEASLPGLMEKMDYEFASPAVEKLNSLKVGLEKALSRAREDVTATKRYTTRLLMILVGLFVVAGVISGAALSRSITTPIRETVDMLRSSVEEGHADLTRRLALASRDEMGLLASWFNKFLDGMSVTVKGVNNLSQDVLVATEKLNASSQKFRNSAEVQLYASEEASSSVGEMEASIAAVSQSAGQILLSTETVASSILEMSASVDEIANNMEKLADSVDTSTSSVTEIGASIRQVAAHVHVLSGFAEEIISSTEEISATIMEIERYAGEQTGLSERVKSDAESLGLESVRKTMSGMERIKEEVSSTSAIINRLGERSEAVAQILKVINNVTDATSLLALNAAILAAQAGEHGKGFAIVADEIKELAEQTASSTKEISGLIKAFREDVGAAVTSIGRSSLGVEEGVELSWEAHNALEKISKSSDQSLEMARKIEIATKEQSRGINLVAESIQKMGGMVDEIKKATDEQKKGAEGIVRAGEQMSDIARMVKTSTLQQAKETKYTSDAVSDVAEKIKSVAGALEEQKLAISRIVSGIETVQKIGEGNAVLSADLDINMDKLKKQASSMKEEMSKFKV